jgi:N-acetyl-anhydromuramyl-L-alanine amidase AmpD
MATKTLKKLGITLLNRLWPTDSVAVHPASLEIVKAGGNLSAKTNRFGKVSGPDLSGLPDGTYTMKVTPDPANTSTGKVDSTFAEAGNPPDRMCRSLEFSITVANELLTGVSQTDTTNGVAELDAAQQQLRVRLQPIWVKTPSRGRDGSAVSLIVIHHTGSSMESAMNTAIGGKGPHYEIDKDGQVVKYVQESRSAGHAGVSQWNGAAVSGAHGPSLNPISIGIEIVHHEDKEFEEPQYTSLLDLLEAILKANPGIKRDRIVGHSDIALPEGGTSSSPLSDRRGQDPGEWFDWTRLEAQGLGLVPKTTAPPPDMYFGFFALFPHESLRTGDDEARFTYGGKSLSQRTKVNPELAVRGKLDQLAHGNPITEIQRDLRAIGYHLGSDRAGHFGIGTEMAVKLFQRHFFTKSRHQTSMTGRVDRITAEMIKRVRP